MDLMIDTETGRRRIPLEENFKILGLTLNPSGENTRLPAQCHTRPVGETCRGE